MFKEGVHNHIHPAKPGQKESHLITKEVKVTANENIFNSAAEIAEKIVMENVAAAPTPALP